MKVHSPKQLTKSDTMTFYLRDKDNKTILDLEVWIKTEDERSFVELSSCVNIKNYSMMLINGICKQQEVISDFDELSELRGWLWETYFAGRQNTQEEYESVVKELKAILQKVADKYDLLVVQD